jgi:hypothetical protein
MDEDGNYYACYFCGDTGWVAQAVVDEEEKAATDYREYKRLRPQMVMQYDNEADYAWEVKRSVLPAELLPAPAPIGWGPEANFDDIPW